MVVPDLELPLSQLRENPTAMESVMNVGLRFARAVARRPVEPHDLLQEAILKCLAALHEGDEGFFKGHDPCSNAFLPFFRTLLRRQASTKTRREARRATHPVNRQTWCWTRRAEDFTARRRSDKPQSFGTSALSVEEAADPKPLCPREANFDKEARGFAIATVVKIEQYLPRKQWEVLEQRILLDRSTSEAAQALGRSPQAICNSFNVAIENARTIGETVSPMTLAMETRTSPTTALAGPAHLVSYFTYDEARPTRAREVLTPRLIVPSCTYFTYGEGQSFRSDADISATEPGL